MNGIVLAGKMKIPCQTVLMAIASWSQLLNAKATKVLCNHGLVSYKEQSSLCAITATD